MKFQVQDNFLEYFFLEIWRFEKRIALSEKKTTFIRNVHFHFRLIKVISTALDFITLANLTMQRQNVPLFEKKNDIIVDYKSKFL